MEGLLAYLNDLERNDKIHYCEIARGDPVIIHILFADDNYLFFKVNYHNQSTKDLIQMPIGPITRARVEKLQEVLNGLMNEFIWVNSDFEENSKSNQAFEGIGANMEVQKLLQELLQQTLGIQS